MDGRSQKQRERGGQRKERKAIEGKTRRDEPSEIKNKIK